MYMWHLNFCVQSILFLTAVILAMFSFTEPDMISLFLILQLVLGFWQYGESLLLLLTKNNRSRLLQLYMILSSFYLVLLTISNVLFGTEKWCNETANVLIIVPFWILTGFYFFITWKRTFPRKEGGKFLRHVSF